ncbi:MAG TPA: LuxR C-terminal-related transcriptional regulator [Flavilitoribacter sp.]|nr:LuxR C-terminal-related transcriptional regulator [Flavilitoribacter sp.]HMQ90708.1 LuxR C-terminal-related transcriptional regulator [Flavilitoribacter sp.]
MKKTILIYGLALALLTFLLKGIEYRYYLRELSVEFYVGAVAVLFSGLGIWMGLKLTQSFRRKETPGVVSSRVDPDPLSVEKLGISPRELEVLQLMAEGCSNQEIADRLFISLNTVKTHTSNLFSKLDVRRRTQAIQRGKELALLS